MIAAVTPINERVGCLTYKGTIAVSLLRLRAVLEQLSVADRALAVAMIEQLVEMQREDIRKATSSLPF